MDLKKPLKTEDQVKRLQDHNMIVSDPGEAEAILEQINYYRLSGYALQYRNKNNDYVNADFSQVLDAYEFDIDLRSILRSYIELVEYYCRTKIAYCFALSKDKMPPYTQHYDPNNYYQKKDAQKVFASLEDEKIHHYQDSLIVRHHKQKYGGKMPMWVIVEILSLSNLSKLYSSMYFSDQDIIAQSMNCTSAVLANHLHCLSVLRNKCAHGGRLYNRFFHPPAMLGYRYLSRHPEIKSDMLFAYILVLMRRLPNFSDKQAFCNDLEDLMEKYDGKIDLSLIGFPQGWKDTLSKEVVPSKQLSLVR